MDKEKLKEYGYLQFPLCLIMEIYRDVERGLNLIISYGIMNYAIKLKYDLQDVAKQVCYYYYRKEDVVQSSIINRLNLAIREELFTPDEDYNGFNGGNFQPDDNISEVLKLLELDPEFKENAILNYQFHLAASKNHLNITIGSNDDTIHRYYEGLRIQKNFEEKFGPDAMPFCKKGMLFEFRDKQQKEIDLFRAYIGIKSMIGRRNFISSNKPAILSRMIGCKSKSAFEYYTTDKYNKNKNLLPIVEKYSKRYHMDKLLLTLAERKYIMFSSKEKVLVIYLSKYMEPEELGKLIKETKDRQNIKQRIKNVAGSL
jgi:hypothetical protein